MWQAHVCPGDVERIKYCVNHRLGWEVAAARPSSSQGSRDGQVPTELGAPGLQVAKQGLQAADTGLGQQRVPLQGSTDRQKDRTAGRRLP